MRTLGLPGAGVWQQGVEPADLHAHDGDAGNLVRISQLRETRVGCLRVWWQAERRGSPPTSRRVILGDGAK